MHKHRHGLATIGVCLLALLFLFGCAGTQTVKDRTETITISFENVGLLAFPMAKAFILQKEANGQWSGEYLLNAKKTYNLAADKFIMATEVVKTTITGTPPPTTLTLQALLIEVSKLLADSTGGTATSTTVTLPVTGGAR